MEPGSARDDVIIVKADEGALSLEFVPLSEGVARAFMRFSPRSMKLSQATAKRLGEELAKRPYSRILVQDNRKGLLRKSLGPLGWGVRRAIDMTVGHNCSMVTTYDLPIDETLSDSMGMKPDMTNTGHMSGISVDLGNRMSWAFFTDDGETARVVSEGERKQGMLVAHDAKDFFEAADCLVHYLAALRKSWAVFSVDMGRFIRKFEPTTMWRMELDRLVGYRHSCTPVSNKNKGSLVKLFSEYYDESTMQAMFRLRRMRVDRNCSVHHIDGGFVITRLEGSTGLIYDIYVTPSRQGEGLGAELMRCGITALAGNVQSCYLHTSYPRAKRLYEKFGFRTTYSQLGIRLDELELSPPTTR